VRNTACDRLLAVRVEQKLKNALGSSAASKEATDILNRIHVSRPLSGVELQPFIPEEALNRQKFDPNDPNRRKLERDIEAEQGGAGVYNVNLKKNYLLENDEWKQDKVPEMFNGKNVYDFIDPEIEAKLAALEEEEEQLQASGFYDEPEDMEDEEEAGIREKAEYIREQQALIKNAARSKKALKNRAIIPRSAGPPKKLSEMESHLDKLGLDHTSISERVRSKSRGRRPTTGEDVDMMDLDASGKPVRAMSQARQNKQKAIERAKSRARSQNRRDDGVTNDGARSQAEKVTKLHQKKMNRMARQGEGDRHTTASIPKHLFAGKRGMGSTRSR